MSTARRPGAAAAAARLAAEHRDTVMAGRTLLQHAVPTTFGLKAAGWLVALDEARSGLARVGREDLAVQLGGAAGTLAALEGRGLEERTQLRPKSWKIQRQSFPAAPDLVSAVAAAAERLGLQRV